MKNTNCLSGKISKYFLSAVFGTFALGFLVVSVTILPGVGLLLALPVAALALYIVRIRLNDQCQIDFSSDTS